MMPRKMRLPFMLAAWAVLLVGTSRAQVSVLGYHNDPASTGQNFNEKKLTPANVNSTSFGKIFAAKVDGQIYAQPLYVPGVAITAGSAKGTTHDVVYVATEHDSVYAFDAVSGVQLWTLSALTVSGETTMPQSETSSSDLSPEIGITSTPVIDPTANASTHLRYLYAVAKTRRVINGVTHYYFRLHAIDIASGAERSGSPVLIAETTYNSNGVYGYPHGPSVAGTGDGAVNGHVTLNAMREHQRCGLTLVNGRLYLAFASHGDNGPYHGWLLGYNPATLILTAVFNSTPNGGEGGLWMGGGLPAADSSGALYVVTGNGSFANNDSDIDAAPSDFDAASFPLNHNYGDSVVKLVVDSSTAANPNGNGWGLRVANYFTPSDQKNLNNTDSDFGSGGAVVLPDSVGSARHPHLLVCCGKEGRVFLIDRDHLGKYRGGLTGSGASAKFASNGNSVVQTTAENTVDGSLDTPAYFNGRFYYAGAYDNDTAKAFGIANGAFTAGPSSTSADGFGYLGATPSISASSATTNGIVWCLDRGNNELRAYNATYLSRELYTSSQAGTARDRLGTAVKFGVPTVADGHVFAGTSEAGGPSALVAYGLFAPATTPPAQPLNLYAQTVSGGEIDLFWDDEADNESGYEVYVATNPNSFPTTPFATAGASATGYAVAGLQDSTTYYFRVRAVNAVGASAYSDTAATSSKTAPTVDFTNGFASASKLLTANGFGQTSPINGSVLRLTDGNSDEGRSVWFNTAENVTRFSAVFTFQFTNAEADGFTFAIQNSALSAVGPNGGDLGYTGIPASVAIKFDLYPDSSTTGLYIDGTAPDDDPTATTTSSGSIDVTPSGIDFHSGNPLRATLIYDGTKLTQTITDLTTRSVFTHTYTVNILKQVGTTGYVGFTAGTGGATSVQDIQAWSFNAALPVAPAAPSGLTATAASATQFNLAWTDNSNNETGFRIERASGDGDFVRVDSVGTNKVAYVDPNLLTNTTYSYRIVATNAGLDSAPSGIVTVTTPVAPTTPSKAAPTLVTAHEVDFGWHDNSNDETGFRILREGGGKNFVTIATLPANSTTYKDTGVAPGIEYNYHIEAYNAAGYVDFTGFDVTTPAK